MDIKRDIMDNSLKWKLRLKRKPLIIQGARQTGKTCIKQKPVSFRLFWNTIVSSTVNLAFMLPKQNTIHVLQNVLFQKCLPSVPWKAFLFH